MRHAQQRVGASQRHACRALRQPRSTQRYQPQTRGEEQRLVQRLRQLSAQHPRYGYRRITVLLRREGWKVNRKRVQRLWRREGLKVPMKQRRKPQRGGGGNAPRRATHPNHVWSYDFVHDQTEDGRPLKFLSLVDEYSRECLALPVARTMRGAQVVAILESLMQERGAPEYLRSDNGPEFVGRAVSEWLRARGVRTHYIEKGAPWENSYCESFNGKLRDELLDRELFSNEVEAKVLARQYRRHYNEERPHSALGYQTPKEFALAWRGKFFPSPSGEGKSRNPTQKLS